MIMIDALKNILFNNHKLNCLFSSQVVTYFWEWSYWVSPSNQRTM